MNFKAVFFDFDYTLADGTEAIVAGFRYAFGRMGLHSCLEVRLLIKK